MSIPLWKMDAILQRLLDEGTDRITGEISDEAMFEIENLELDREMKLLAIAGYIKGERLEGQAVKSQADHLAARALGHARRADRLEDYVKKSLKAGESVRDDKNWLKWRKSTGVVVDDMKRLPPGYITTTTTSRPDKKAIAAALKDGRDVAGARLEKRNNLVIE